MPAEHQFKIQARAGNGFCRNEYRLVRFTHAACATPTSLGVSINGSPGARAGAIVILSVTLGGPGELHRVGVRAGLELTQEKIALGSFLEGRAWTMCRESLVRQGFEPNGRNPFRDVGEPKLVEIAFGSSTAGKNRIVRLN